MELSHERIIELTIKYLRNELSEVDRADLDQWLADPYNKMRFEQRVKIENVLEGIVLMESAKEEMDAQKWKPEPAEEMEEVIRLKERSPAVGRGARWMVAAAAVIAIGMGVIWLLVGKQIRSAETGRQIVARDLPPGGNKAVLTLASGATLSLDSTTNGVLTQQGKVQVTKLNSGEIAYVGSAASGDHVMYNSIATPRGGEFKLALSDGSKVWINAATVLRYPTTFSGANRTVELLRGEAYFEIAKEVSRPFFVRVPGSGAGDKDLVIQVLGTSFDVNAYPDEPGTCTTLISGSVKIAKGDRVALLHPEQQARTNANSTYIGIESQVDAGGVVAWKDGLFSFDRAGTEAVMRQLARWYDVDITYEGVIPVRQFVGTIPRNMTAADVLKALELNNVHFRIDGRRIIVMP